MRSPFGNLAHGTGDWERRAVEIEKEVFEKIRHGHHVSRNTHVEAAAHMRFGDRVADRLAAVAGSWRFIIGFLILLVVWISLNVSELVGEWDKYPFILLNLMLSMVAALAPVIMMSQGARRPETACAPSTTTRLTSRRRSRYRSLTASSMS